MDRPLSFPRERRIRTSRDYQRHRGRSRIFRTRNFLVAWAPGLESEGRLGLTVSRKAGCAVRRNRIKRVVREWYRLNRSEFLRSWDLVLIARPGSHSPGLKEVEQELGELVAWLNRRK